MPFVLISLLFVSYFIALFTTPSDDEPGKPYDNLSSLLIKGKI